MEFPLTREGRSRLIRKTIILATVFGSFLLIAPKSKCQLLSDVMTKDSVRKMLSYCELIDSGVDYHGYNSDDYGNPYVYKGAKILGYSGTYVLYFIRDSLEGFFWDYETNNSRISIKPALDIYCYLKEIFGEPYYGDQPSIKGNDYGFIWKQKSGQYTQHYDLSFSNSWIHLLMTHHGGLQHGDH
jgi:hypothetical protein